MKNTKRIKKISVHTLLLIIIAVISVVYIRYTWIRFEEEKSGKALQIAQSIAFSLPVEDIKALEVKPSDIENPRYRNLKNILTRIISINKTARFAYLYTEINGKIFFVADSEPEASKDYSPPGQEYTEATPEDKEIFLDGKEIVTRADTDRWGTWISPLIPVKDPSNGKIIAVFGMDFDAKEWNNFIIYEVIESSVLVLLLLFFFFFFIKIKSKNNSLKNEITDRELAEDSLQKSHNLLAKLSAQVPGVIYQYRLYTDGRSCFPYASPGIKEIYEVSPEEVLKDAEPVYGRLHPDDYDRVVADISESARTLEHFRCEFRVVLPRQGLRWRLCDALPERMDDNSTLWHGIISDITERRQSETELCEKANELERYNKLMIGRELKMIELKKEVNSLLKTAGQKEKYEKYENG